MAFTPTHQTLINSLILALAGILFSCESSSPPPMPDPAQNGVLKDSRNSSDEDGKSNSEDAKEPDFKPVKPSIGGAEIGDEGSKSAVKICNTEGFYYDRYTGEKGSCTKIALASVKCTEKGIQKILTEFQTDQFRDSLKKSYKGWLIDQCIDCSPRESNEICKNKDGDEQVGTKVFFVKPDDVSAEIRGKSMFLPVRPKTKSSSKKAKSEDSTDNP